MVWYSIPVVLMAPICLYVGVRHIKLFFKEKADKKNLVFGLISLCFMVFMTCSYFMYSQKDVKVISVAFVIQYCSIAIAGFLMIVFIDQLENRKTLIPKIIFGTGFLILLTLGLINPNLIADPELMSVLSFTFMNQQVSYHEPFIGIYFDILDGFVLLGIIYLARGIFMLSFVKRKRGLASILIPLTIFLFCIINDILVISGLYKMFYIIDLGFFILMLALDSALYQEVLFHKSLPGKDFNTRIDRVTSMIKGSSILERINSVLKQSTLYHFEFAVLLVEFPLLKTIKESSYEYNNILIEVSEKIRAVLRPYDETGRISIERDSTPEDVLLAQRSGDASFAILLPHCKKDGIEQVFLRLENEIKQITFKKEHLKYLVGATLSGDREVALETTQIIDRAAKGLRICKITDKSFEIIDIDGTNLT